MEALSLEAGGAISTTDLKVDVERCGGLKVRVRACVHACVHVCVVLRSQPLPFCKRGGAGCTSVCVCVCMCCVLVHISKTVSHSSTKFRSCMLI